MPAVQTNTGEVEMTRRVQISAWFVVLLLAFFGVARVGAPIEPAAPARFAVANVHLEQNATDGDVEVVFEVKGGDDGLSMLKVAAPDGRTVIDCTSPDASTLGIRQFRFESPEPTDMKSLLSAYPEGVYTFSGASVSDVQMQGTATLSHDLPTPPSGLSPKNDAEGVVVKGLEITWSPVNKAVAYILYIEQDQLEVELTVRLLGSAKGFAVPDGFLLPSTEYMLGLGAVASNGNTSFVETSFTTESE